MALVLTHSSATSHRNNCFYAADFTAAFHEVHTYVKIRLTWKRYNERRGIDVHNEKCVFIQKFHVSKTTGIGNIWYGLVVGITSFGLCNAICFVGHYGRFDQTTPKKENVQSNTSVATSLTKMSAVLKIDNSITLTSTAYSANRKRAISGTYQTMA